STVWFWMCAVGYPILAWSFALVASLAYRQTARGSALANNRVSDEAEQACHEAASQPLTVYGYGWRFSSDKEENGLRSILDGQVQSGLRPSAAFPGNDVHARWIDIPEQPFYPGNELGEHTRHLVVCEWLVTHVLADVSEALVSLPAKTLLHVHLCLHSRLKVEPVVARVQQALQALHAPSDVRIEFQESLSIFTTDGWLDRRDRKVAHLVIAIQLRNAISEMLVGGAAEAGVALLLGHPRLLEEPNASALRLHRPARGKANEAADVIGRASRWGKTSAKEFGAIWTNGLLEDDQSLVRRSVNVSEQAQWRSIESSVGHCEDAGGWLAVALAAANADQASSPQLVLCAQDSELTALVCRKHT
ncbi:hypothetical protein, partial [Caballeronia sp. BR00000012568055]|uniref:hypothetical protein n=1 Tax=Caballeronia sp. BR00000012568055 TaxID=2918761 RepID=UPI0023F76828